MGLLDMFGGMNPEQQQGLLAAAAQLAQSSGPSRAPVNLAAGLANAGLAYRGSIEDQRRKQLEEERFQQAMKMQDFVIRDKESDYKKQEEDRTRQATLRSLAQKYYGGGAIPGAGQNPAASMGGEVFANAAAGAGLPGDNATLNKIVDGVNAGQSPQAAAQAIAPGAKASAYQRKLAFADYLRQNGQPEQADAEEAAALKLKPKISEWQKVEQGGKVMYAPYFDDGTYGEPVPYAVAEKLHFANLNGKTVGVDQYTGATKSTYAHSVSPDTAATIAAARERTNFERSQGGKPPAGYRWTEGGSLEAIPGGPASLAAKMAKAPTEFQGKSGIFGMRAEEADSTIRELEGKYSPSAVNAKVAVQDTWLVGGMAGAAVNKYGLSANDQKAEQSQRDFINAVLRLESGAAIGKDEFDNARRQYFPQPGDSKDVIAQKARNRAITIQGLKSNAGGAAMTAPAKAAASGGWSIQKVN